MAWSPLRNPVALLVSSLIQRLIVVNRNALPLFILSPLLMAALLMVRVPVSPGLQRGQPYRLEG